MDYARSRATCFRATAVCRTAILDPIRHHARIRTWLIHVYTISIPVAVFCGFAAHTHTRGEQRGAGAMSSATDAFLGTAPFTYEDELAEAVHESLMTGFVPGYVKREAKEEDGEL